MMAEAAPAPTKPLSNFGKVRHESFLLSCKSVRLVENGALFVVPCSSILLRSATNQHFLMHPAIEDSSVHGALFFIWNLGSQAVGCYYLS